MDEVKEISPKQGCKKGEKNKRKENERTKVVRFKI